MSAADVLETINDYRELKGKYCMGLNAIAGALERMKAKKVAVSKQYDKDSRVF